MSYIKLPRPMAVTPEGLIPCGEHTLIKPRMHELEELLREVQANYRHQSPWQTLKALVGYMQAESEELKRFLNASGMQRTVYPSAEAKTAQEAPKKVHKYQKLTTKARAALHVLAAKGEWLSAQEVAEAIYHFDSRLGLIREGAASSACRDARKAGYAVQGEFQECQVLTPEGTYTKRKIYKYFFNGKVVD